MSVKNYLLFFAFFSISCSVTNEYVLENKTKQFFTGFLYKFQDIFFQTQIKTSEPTTENYDVLSQNLKIIPNFDNNSIEAVSDIKLVITSETKSIELNFYSGFKILKLLTSPYNSTFNYNSNKLEIIFNEPLEINDSINIYIHYSGKPKKFRNNGFFMGKNKSGNYCFTLNEANLAHTWFPCKDSPSDKFLSQMSIVTPNNLYAISNGRLLKVTKIDSTTKLYDYYSEYPITSYLVSFAVGNYISFVDTIKSITNEKFPVEYYVFPDQLSFAKRDFENHKEYFKFFEEKFGPYPFRKEKYAVVCVDWYFGGMENQTITFIGKNFIDGFKMNDELLSHELAHSWFGNSVSVKEWKDIWLNEGFATFSQLIYKAHSKNINEYEIFKNLNNKIYYGSVYNPPITLFSSTVYDKAAFIIFMLKNKLGDSLFYNTLKSYIKFFAYKNVDTKEFISFFENKTNIKLNDFFEQWLYTDIDKPLIFVDISEHNNNDSTQYIFSLTQLQKQIFKLKISLEITFNNNETLFLILDVNQLNSEKKIITDKKIKKIKFNSYKPILTKTIYSKKIKKYL